MDSSLKKDFTRRLSQCNPGELKAEQMNEQNIMVLATGGDLPDSVA